MVVIIATCGRTSLTRGVISPAWFMPIAVLALDGEERLAWLDRACVDRKSRNSLRQRAHACRVHGGHHGVEGPERLGHATFSFSAAATASWSLNGNTASPTIWPLS